MVFCLPFNKLQKSLEMVSGTSDQAFRRLSPDKRAYRTSGFGNSMASETPANQAYDATEARTSERGTNS